MRLPALWLICALASASGNPRVTPGVELYISYEKLAATIDSTNAELHGTFRFTTVGHKSYASQTVGIQLPIWFPADAQENSAIAAFWSVFDQAHHTHFSAKEKQTLDEILRLKVELSGKELRPELLMVSGRGDSGNFIPKNWEVLGCRVLLLWFATTPELIESGAKLTVSYQQPLLTYKGERYFVYIPIFEHLPNSISTSNTNLYSVNLTAGPNCDLAVTTAALTSPVGPGQQVTLSPQNLQLIRAVVRAQANDSLHSTPR